MATMQTTGKRRRRDWLGALLVAACAFIQWPAQARAVSSEAQLPALAQAWLDQTLAAQAARDLLPVRLEATLGALDSRLRLAPCARAEAYLPPGSRLWGRSRIGLRCLDGARRWNVSMPVTVKATGPAWVLRRDVAPGQAIDAVDLIQAEVDWTAEASPVLAGRDAVLGQVATRALGAGQTLRQNMVRAPQVFQAGAQVRVLVQGGGFQISALALALSPGVVGQPARVRTESGRVLSATVLDARTVRVEL